MKKITACFLLGLSTIALSADASDKYDPENLFIKMKPGLALAESTHIESSSHLIDDIYLVKTKNISALSAEMSTLSSVEYVERDHYSDERETPKHEVIDPLGGTMLKSYRPEAAFFQFNDPLIRDLWAFDSRKGMSVASAYDILPLRVPQEIIVAVVDTGVDSRHEDLKDAMWINKKEIPGNGIDDDGNGYIDDINGINTLIRDTQGKATMNTRSSVGRDGHEHGTHVAGTIAATQNNYLGIAGVAKNVKIMAIRTVPDQNDEKDSDIVEGFIYAANNGARIINCSFGKNKNERGMIVRDTINALAKKGVLVVAAAGNDGTNNDIKLKYPASFDSENMMVIAATDSFGKLADFSNSGVTTVDIAAPGTMILSTVPGNRYEEMDGTSMATPNASGVAAMVLGYYPSLTPAQLKKLLMTTADTTPELKHHVGSAGRINLKKALQRASEI